MMTATHIPAALGLTDALPLPDPRPGLQGRIVACKNFAAGSSNNDMVGRAWT